MFFIPLRHPHFYLLISMSAVVVVAVVVVERKQ